MIKKLKIIYDLVSLNLMKFVMESNVSDMCIPFI